MRQGDLNRDFGIPRRPPATPTKCRSASPVRAWNATVGRVFGTHRLPGARSASAATSPGRAPGINPAAPGNRLRTAGAPIGWTGSAPPRQRDAVRTRRDRLRGRRSAAPFASATLTFPSAVTSKRSPLPRCSTRSRSPPTRLITAVVLPPANRDATGFGLSCRAPGAMRLARPGPVSALLRLRSFVVAPRAPNDAPQMSCTEPASRQ